MSVFKNRSAHRKFWGDDDVVVNERPEVPSYCVGCRRALEEDEEFIEWHGIYTFNRRDSKIDEMILYCYPCALDFALSFMRDVHEASTYYIRRKQKKVKS